MGANANAPSGWYLDPADTSQWRLWDGRQWTDNVAPRDSDRRSLQLPAATAWRVRPPPVASRDSDRRTPTTGKTSTERVESPPGDCAPGVPSHWGSHKGSDPTGSPPTSEPQPATDWGPYGLPLASRGRRLMARVIDHVCLLAATYVIATEVSRHIDAELSEALVYERFAILLIVPWFLWEFVPQAFTGRTLGKAVLGIRIVRGGDSAGDRFLAAFIRSVGVLLWLVPLTLLVSCITIFGKKRRTIPDMLARTSVVRHAPVRALRLLTAALMVMILGASVGYGYLSVWRPAAMVGTDWEPLSSFIDSDQITAEALSDPDILDYDMVVFRNIDTPIWDLVFFTGDAADEKALVDELWDDFLMVDCYWYRGDDFGSPGVAFDWPQLASADGSDVELSWRASTGSSGQAVGLMNYESQAVGGAWIAAAGLTEGDIRNDLRVSGYTPDELDGIPIVSYDFYQALVEADSITLTAGATSNSWDLPEDSSSLRSLMERCEGAHPQDSSPVAATPSSEATPSEDEHSEPTTGGSLQGSVDPTDRSAASTCEFSDRSAAVGSAVFQVFSGEAIGTAFYIGDDEWVTAAHVVENPRSVVLRNGTTELTATVKGSHLVADIALLEATATGIAALRFGHLEEVGAGSRVFAIGFPLYEATEPSVTSGVLSRVEQYEDLGEVIVTDAPINAGNSGGPLVGVCGDVIGMNVAKQVGTDVEGIGYAIAETTLQDSIPSLRDAGPANVAAPVTTASDAAVALAGEGWFYHQDANIDGDFEYYWLEAIWHSGYEWQDAPTLILRCGTTGTLSLDSLFVWTPFLIFNDYDYASSTVRYRFEGMAVPFTESSWWSSEEPNSVLFAPEDTSFAEHLARAASGRLYMEFIPGSTVGNSESAEFIVDGAADVLRALDCW